MPSRSSKQPKNIQPPNTQPPQPPQPPNFNSFKEFFAALQPSEVEEVTTTTMTANPGNPAEPHVIHSTDTLPVAQLKSIFVDVPEDNSRTTSGGAKPSASIMFERKAPQKATDLNHPAFQTFKATKLASEELNNYTIAVSHICAEAGAVMKRKDVLTSSCIVVVEGKVKLVNQQNDWAHHIMCVDQDRNVSSPEKPRRDTTTEYLEPGSKSFKFVPERMDQTITFKKTTLLRTLVIDNGGAHEM